MSDILNLISNGQEVIEPLDGTASIVSSGSVFASYVDEDFKELGLDRPGQVTPETGVLIYEVIDNTGLASIFNSLAKNWDDIVLTQGQIVQFCQKYPKWFGHGQAALFLIKGRDEYFAVCVRGGIGGLGAEVVSCEHERPWFGVVLVVVPVH